MNKPNVFKLKWSNSYKQYHLKYTKITENDKKMKWMAIFNNDILILFNYKEKSNFFSSAPKNSPTNLLLFCKYDDLAFWNLNEIH